MQRERPLEAKHFERSSSCMIQYVLRDCVSIRICSLFLSPNRGLDILATKHRCFIQSNRRFFCLVKRTWAALRHRCFGFDRRLGARPNTSSPRSTRILLITSPKQLSSCPHPQLFPCRRSQVLLIVVLARPLINKAYPPHCCHQSSFKPNPHALWVDNFTPDTLRIS